MFRFTIHLCGVIFANLFILQNLVILQNLAFAEDIRCDNLELCEAEITSALQAKESRKTHALYYNISRAFASFGQLGFDALFEMMEVATGDNQDMLLASLSHMKDDRRNSSEFIISPAQYETLTQMWSLRPGYSVGGLINFADMPASHAFMIETLQSKDEEQRYWGKRIINIQGFGNGTSPIESKHLPDILDLIQRLNHSNLVLTLTRIDKPQAMTALWSLLDSHDEWVFAKAFEILLVEDEAKVYQTLKAQSFSDTPADHQRALMIAETIRRERHRAKPSQMAYDFWTAWYDAAETSETESIIPAYQLFYLFEVTKKQVDGSDKFIEDRERWRSLTQANPEGRTGHLSVEHLTREIQNKRAETASLTPFLQLQAARLTKGENQTFEDYFRIFDAQRLSRQIENYTYGGGEYLPLTDVLDTVIQTPALWASRLWTYIDDQPFAENTAIVEKITTLEVDEGRLKSFYLNRLRYTDNIPKLLGTLRLIAQKDVLRNDRDIRNAVKAVSQSTPFTTLHMAANNAMLETKPRHGISPYGAIMWGSAFDAMMIEENAKRTYCNPASQAEPDYMLVQPDLNPPLIETYNQLGRAVMTIKTPSGYLSGHDRGEFGGGLVYYSDIAAKGRLLSLRYAHNIIAIVESETEGVYWALAGLNHLMPGMGAIYEVDARTDSVMATPHKLLPNVPRETSFLKGGGLFMDFRARSFTTIDMENGGIETIHKLEGQKYNPPVILTRNGELASACGD